MLQLPLLKNIGIELRASRLFSPLSMTPEQETRVRARQLSAITELSNVAVLACLLNLVVLVLIFWDGRVGRLVSLWGGLMALILTYVAIALQIQRRRAPQTALDDDQVKSRIASYLRATTTLGVMWGIIALVIIPFSDPIGLTASGMLLMGTMFGGVLLMGVVPGAVLGLVIPILFGTLAGLQIQQDPRNTLLSIMILSYTGVIMSASRLTFLQFVHQHLNQMNSEERQETIGLLLRDFEENTSDWQWETDIEGVLRARLESDVMTKKSSSRMQPGLSLFDMFEANDAFDVLQSAIADRRPFRDIVLKFGDKYTENWLMLSGKPIFVEGAFVGYRGVASDVTHIKKTEQHAAFITQYDALTGLPNRETFKNKLTQLSNDIYREKENIALVWLDLDNFKWINDTMGHMAGDELLCQLARRLTDTLAKLGCKGSAARITGDEFVFFFHYTEEDAPLDTMNAFEAALSQPYSLWGSKMNCRATMGVKCVPYGTFDVERSLKQADMALHNAKVHNKGSWVQFSQSLEDRAQAKRKLEADLDLAMERDELRLYFQPIADANTGKVVSCETLLRWQHPTRGLLTPGAFIGFAEDTGVITRLGDWVLREALVQARRMPEDMRVAINLSPLQLHSQHLLSTIINSIAQNGLKPDRVELEITESVMISDPEFTLTQMRKLKEIGVRIALDDFGTGFSSLSYLQKFQFDKLKIDRSFVEDIDINVDNQAITLATLQLAKALGMSTTGEGVETPRQAEYLRAHGCDQLQGFMISRPLPLDQLSHLFDVKPVSELQAVQPVPLSSVPEYKYKTNKVA